ncbi:hypothetical protein BU17DRAFT_77408 [Hysterangium stoloniferum]|nr:hypothetical protein BU17DRAFT_77408 [Hysterangium stoloniferum]
MSLPQQILAVSSCAYSSNCFWSNSIILPIYAALGLRAIQGLKVISSRRRNRSPLASPTPTPQTLAPSQSFLHEAREYFRALGSVSVTLKLIRLLATFVLANYCCLLALVDLMPPKKWNSSAGTHLTIVMFCIASVYTYRDLIPYATFTMIPVDAAEGWLLWSRFGLATVAGVLIPLVTPRAYKPIDPLNPFKQTHPEQTASLASFLTYSYLDPIILKAALTKQFSYDDFPPLADYDHSKYLISTSQPVLEPSFTSKRRHLFWGLTYLFSTEFTVMAIMTIIKCLSGFTSPFALNMLLKYLENGQNGDIRPWVWVACLFIGPTIGSLAIHYYLFVTNRLLVHTEAILTQLVFDHSLRVRFQEEEATGSRLSTSVNTPETGSITDGDTEVDNESREETQTAQSTADSSRAATKQSASRISSATKPSAAKTTLKEESSSKSSHLIGRINNLVTTDLGNVTDAKDFIYIALFGPLQFCISAWFLYDILNWSAVVGMALTGAYIFSFPGYITGLMGKVQAERMKQTDGRVQSVTEILSVIRMIKLFGWEDKVNSQIAEKREAELSLLKKRELLGLVNNNTLVQKETLTASKVFTSMSVFIQLRDSIHDVFAMLPVIINAKISLTRISDFLLHTPLLDNFTFKNSNADQIVDPTASIPIDMIGFRNASFSWVAEKDITSMRPYRLQIEGELSFKPGSLNLVIGPTGCGKTSLLMALLGEMHFEPIGEGAGFRLPRDGGVAYAAQEAWVQNETIKENILFGKAFEEERYNKVIYQCGLIHDLGLFDAGDNTEVGEKGLTLSGGQKARITLARAVYSTADIILLDDILAALDVHTSKFIIEKCLQGDLLSGRTIILVTHNIAMVAPIASFVVSLGLDGRVISQKSVLTADRKGSALSEATTEATEASDMTANIIDAVDTVKKDMSNASPKLVVEEELAFGHISWDTLKLHLSTMGGIAFWVIFVVSLLLQEVFKSISTWLLGYWATQYETKPTWAIPVVYYLSLYALIIFMCILLYCIAMGLFLFGFLKASRVIHQRLITSVLGSTLRWLDTVPTARIVTRCTQDIRVVDGPLPSTISNLIHTTATLLILLLSVVIFVPVFVFPGIMAFIVGTIYGQLYIQAQLPIKREMSNRRSPVIAHFNAAISGLVSIRAYGAQCAFRDESLRRIDKYSRPARVFHNARRWMGIRIDAIGSGFTTSLAAYLVYNRAFHTPSEVGFALAMAVAFAQRILWWKSLERIQAYFKIDQEPITTSEGVPPAYWPASGSLSVQNLSARYSMHGPEVLHNISFDIKSGERVGVVGRTGSGKSSLTLSLLRGIPTEGQVIFDNIPIHSVNLNTLRSSITIIPQVPELLSGTLRENLDPFSEHSDATLYDALRVAGLFSLQDENSDPSSITLDSVISGGGGNFSVGQRQILALARAVLRRSKLVILDEATSAIDYATDSVIQNMLKDVLKEASLIIVAHRLQTIMDADKIMVLDAGRMVEFDAPMNLLKKHGGHFKSLVDESGDREILYAMAEEASRRRHC